MSTQTRCRFEKALISGTGECARAKRREISERLFYFCNSPAAALRCERYISLLRDNTRFVFRQTRAGDSILSNYQEICLQCGGLQGLATLSRGESTNDKFEISSLLEAVDIEGQGIENIPLDRIITRIAAYNPRPHRKRK